MEGFQVGISFADLFILYLSLQYCLVSVLQPCGHMLGLLGSPVCNVFLCFITFPCGILGQVLYLIVLIPDFCLITFIFTKLLLMVCKIIQLFQMDYITLDSRIKSTHTKKLIFS